MSDRYKKIGIKQAIRLEWMNKTTELLLEGYNSNEIRSILDEYLSSRKQSGGVGERGKKTYGIALGILSSWFSPAKDLEEFRNYLLSIAENVPSSKWLPLHWSILSASYPFWLNLAIQVGRLLSLQESISQKQIFDRIKEQYGDRETVARNSRYNVRSLIYWCILTDTDKKGIYTKGEKIEISDVNLVLPLIESYILAFPRRIINLNEIINTPGFFPFELDGFTEDQIIASSDRIIVVNPTVNGKFITLNY